MKTPIAKTDDISRDWYVVDATDLVLGRMAAKVATILRGKHKALFSPHLDIGDFVIVVNAEKVRFTGRKWDQKVYYRHSGYPGGISGVTARRMRDEHPERIIEYAVKGMLPKNRLGSRLLKKLKVYAGPDHPHKAQMPQTLTVDM